MNLLISIDGRFYRSLGAAALAAVFLAGCGGAAERKAKYLEKGQTLYEQRNHDKAQLELRNALQIDPKDARAHFLLGRILEDKRDFSAAARSFLAAIEQEPKSVDARVRLGRLYLLGGAPDRAVQVANEALELAPDNAAAIALRGGIKGVQGDVDGAIKDGERALALDPAETDAISLVAGLYVKKKRVDDAIKLLADAVEKRPDHIVLRVLLADVYAGQGRDDEAAVQLQKIIEQKPDELAHRLRLASYYAKRKRLDDAEAVLRAAVESAQDERAHLALLDFLARERGPEAAEKESLNLLEREPKNHAVRLGLARFYESKGAADKAEAAYRRIIADDKRGPDGLTARNRLAVLLLRAGEREPAAALLDEVLAENAKDNDALLLRARLALADGKPAAAIADLRTVQRDQPESMEVLRLLGTAHARNGEATLGIDVLRKAVQLKADDVGARLELAQQLGATGDIDGALDQYREVLKLNPKELAALETMFKIHVAREDWDAVDWVRGHVKRNLRGHAFEHFLTGLVHQNKGRYAASIAEFEAALKKAPTADDVLFALVRSHLAQKQPAKARARLQTAVASAPSNAAAHSLLGEVYLVEKNMPEALKSFRHAIKLNPRLVSAHRNLAMAHLLGKDAQNAEAALKEGIRATNGDVSLMAELALFYQRGGKADAAMAQYEEMLQKAPDSQLAANNLAMLLVSHRTDRNSLARAKELVERLGNTENPVFLDTVGWVRYKHGDVDAAIRALERAADKAKNEPLLHYHLGMAYYGRGDTERARQYLGRALESKTDFSGKEEAKLTFAKLNETASP